LTALKSLGLASFMLISLQVTRGTRWWITAHCSICLASFSSFSLDALGLKGFLLSSCLETCLSYCLALKVFSFCVLLVFLHVLLQPDFLHAVLPFLLFIAFQTFPPVFSNCLNPICPSVFPNCLSHVCPPVFANCLNPICPSVFSNCLSHVCPPVFANCLSPVCPSEVSYCLYPVCPPVCPNCLSPVCPPVFSNSLSPVCLLYFLPLVPACTYARPPTWLSKLQAVLLHSSFLSFCLTT
jgi:hypothetical protein